MVLKYFKSFIYIMIFILNNISNAQEIKISIAPQKLSVGNNLKITITIDNDQIQNYGQFPEIPGFRKSGISSSSSTNFINGKMSSTQSIIQNYRKFDRMGAIVKQIRYLSGVDVASFQQGIISRVDTIVENILGASMLLGLVIFFIAVIFNYFESWKLCIQGCGTYNYGIFVFCVLV